MQHIISRENVNLINHDSYSSTHPAIALINNFLAWCHIQEKNRFLWMGLAFIGGIGTVVPITLASIVFGAGNNYNLWLITCFINVPILIVNLAALPTRFTLPILFVAWLVDIAVIGYSLSVALHH